MAVNQWIDNFCEKRKWSHFKMEPEQPFQRTGPNHQHSKKSARTRTSCLKRLIKVNSAQWPFCQTNQWITNRALLVSTNETFLKTTYLIFLLLCHKNPESTSCKWNTIQVSTQICVPQITILWSQIKILPLEMFLFVCLFLGWHSINNSGWFK